MQRPSSVFSTMSPLATLLENKLKLRAHPAAQINPPRDLLAADAIRFREGVLMPNGAIATWGPAHATGRIPQDTYTVKHDDSVDWSQSTNRPITPETFDELFHDALHLLTGKSRLYITDRVVGAEAKYALPVRTITDSALASLFTCTMFRPVPSDMQESVFADHGFTLLVLPWDRIDVTKYKGVLRDVQGKTVDYAVLMDFSRRAGIVFGTQYLGAIKKLLFTTMNNLLPAQGVLPLHCSAVEDRRGATHLFLGLSGTGKTTLSSGPGLTMIGDDEHLWSDSGVANMEYGCYAKLIHLSKEKEPDIYEAVFGHLGQEQEKPIVENAMTHPNGTVDLDDERLTENSRAAYVLSRLRSVKADSRGGHPSTIVFLTADAQGVLPPIARLPVKQAMFWFLMGYTSKLAGTEMGVKSPQTTFSRFFGGVFMPRQSEDYLSLFQRLLSTHQPHVYLVNTGWTGGPYEGGKPASAKATAGKRMDITLTRRLVDAALSGQIKDVQYREDKLFHLLVPKECPGVDAQMLDPRSTWSDAAQYDQQANALASEFSTYFDKLAKSDMLQTLRSVCPGN